MTQKKIFVNYRHSDLIGGEVSQLFQALTKEFGVDSIEIDLEFNSQLKYDMYLYREALNWDTVLVIIGPTWLSSQDSEGKFKIHSETDFVRMEISACLTSPDIRVIPVLIGGAELPDRDDLPNAIKDLSLLTPLELRTDAWEWNLHCLIEELKNRKDKKTIFQLDTLAESLPPDRTSDIFNKRDEIPIQQQAEIIEPKITVQAPKIFISHRKLDTQSDCRPLSTALRRGFGKENIFFDISSLEAGTRFGKVIEQTLAISKIILVVIGPDWAGTKPQNELPRIFEENDWVRKEVSIALSQTTSWVIPILVKNASMPKRSELPDDLQSLVEIQHFEISNTRWDHDVKTLIRHLKKLIQKNPEEL